MVNKSVRVRIAPSPTGPLHVGTARAALFNELYARQNKGKFVLRIEDTDKTRSRPEFEKDIMEGLAWLGLKWDEGPETNGQHGPYRQSERSSVYTAAIAKLLDSGAAYKVSGGQAIRLRVTEEEIVFDDLIRGQVRVKTESWGGDFVIARSQNDPVFHLAVVVDDEAQGITHVIRGEDHLSNTGRHILLQRALGITTPVYVHLPLLLDEQRKKLSKRNNEVSLLAYREKGFLPAAMLNYLALLGWNPGDEREFFTHEELVKEFSLVRVQKGGAIFSVKKLESMNQHYLRKLTGRELLAAARPFLEQAGFNLADEGYWEQAVLLEKDRVATLAEIPEAIKFCRPDFKPEYEASILVWRKSSLQKTAQAVEALRVKLMEIAPNSFVEDSLQTILLDWLDTTGLDRGEVLWPMRVALTAQENSPGPFAVAAVLGKPETMRRLALALKLISQI